MNSIIRDITKDQLKSDRNNFKVGDGVAVHAKVREGDKERIQIFSGIVIAKSGTGIEETFTVRRISHGEGVERIFPLHSPNIDKVEVERTSVITRAKLHFLRDRVGKQASKVKEQVYSEK